MQRLSELCCFAVSQLLILGKSVISHASKMKSEETYENTVKIEWPGDSVSKAKIIRFKAQSMSGDVETVYNSFSTGVSHASIFFEFNHILGYILSGFVFTGIGTIFLCQYSSYGHVLHDIPFFLGLIFCLES